MEETLNLNPDEEESQLAHEGNKWQNQDCLTQKLKLNYCQQRGFRQVTELAFPYLPSIDNMRMFIKGTYNK